MKKYKPVTMHDIARYANVSVASVSRVLNKPEYTTLYTQKKVTQAIEALNYDTTALIKPYHAHHQNRKILVIDNQYLSRGMINRGIEDTAKKHGYKLLYLRFIYFTEQEIQQIITYTIYHQIEGILLINDSPYLSQLEKYHAALPPIILLNHYSRTLSCLCFDHLAIAYQATDYLIKHGHKKIACLVGLKSKQSSDFLIKGYSQALQRAALEPNSSYIHYQCVNFDSAQSRLKQLLHQAVPPTAIFCHDNNCLNYHDQEQIDEVSSGMNRAYVDENSIINGLLTQARKLKYHLPSQLSLICTSTHMHNETFVEPLVTYMYKPMYQMGEQGFAMLMTQIKQQNKQYQSLMISSDIIPRHSVADKNL